jgi:hypothetical protein
MATEAARFKKRRFRVSAHIRDGLEMVSVFFLSQLFRVGQVGVILNYYFFIFSKKPEKG